MLDLEQLGSAAMEIIAYAGVAKLCGGGAVGQSISL